jgi:hypothetical protein
MSTPSCPPHNLCHDNSRYKPGNSSLCNVLHSKFSLPLVGTNTLFSSWLSNTCLRHFLSSNYEMNLSKIRAVHLPNASRKQHIYENNVVLRSRYKFVVALISSSVTKRGITFVYFQWVEVLHVFVTFGSWRDLNNPEFHNLYSSQ